MAQISHGPNSENSSIAKALFLQAGKLNGLSGSDLKPWHLKVSFAFLDDSGKPTDQGTIEALWAAPDMVKTVFTNSTGKLINTTTKNGRFREGEVNQKMALLQLLEDAFVQPIGISPQALTRLHLTLQTRQVGTVELRCLTVEDPVGVHFDFNNPSYCLDSTRPILRSNSFPDDPHQFTIIRIGTYQGRYVPVQVEVANANRTDLSAHLESLREIGKVDPGDFRPSNNAVFLIPARHQLVVPADGLELLVRSNRVHEISCPQPEYPAAAKAANIHGTVRLRATIGTDGRIVKLHVIDGPALLQQAALDTVWKWRFEPPFQSSEHAQILTEIVVHL